MGVVDRVSGGDNKHLEACIWERTSSVGCMGSEADGLLGEGGVLDIPWRGREDRSWMEEGGDVRILE